MKYTRIIILFAKGGGFVRIFNCSNYAVAGYVDSVRILLDLLDRWMHAVTVATFRRSGSETSVNERVVACAKGAVRFMIHATE